MNIIHYSIRFKTIIRGNTDSLNSRLVSQVASKFVGAFQCDQQCGNLTDEDLLAECNKQFCAQDQEEDAYADYYDEEAEQTV